jgi:hypothetical protein
VRKPILVTLEEEQALIRLQREVSDLFGVSLSKGQAIAFSLTAGAEKALRLYRACLPWTDDPGPRETRPGENDKTPGRVPPPHT